MTGKRITVGPHTERPALPCYDDAADIRVGLGPVDQRPVLVVHPPGPGIVAVRAVQPDNGDPADDLPRRGLQRELASGRRCCAIVRIAHHGPRTGEWRRPSGIPPGSPVR